MREPIEAFKPSDLNLLLDSVCHESEVRALESYCTKLETQNEMMLEALISRALFLDSKGGDGMTIAEELEFTSLSEIIQNATGKEFDGLKERKSDCTFI